MLIAKADGRLANQLFFISILDATANEQEVVIATGFEGLLDVFPGLTIHFPRLIHIPKTTWRRWGLDHIMGAAARFRIIGRAELEPGQDRLKRSRALLRSAMLPVGFYQHSRLQRDRIPLAFQKHLYSRHVKQAQSFGLTLGTNSGRLKCFVHVRRGDYLSFPDSQFPAALPPEWYLEQIDQIRKLQPDTEFLAFSDDLEFCESTFGGLSDVSVVDAGPEESFLLMSLCDSGILSASSFSWWAARLASRVQGGPFIAPNFWFWWALGFWKDDTLRDSQFLTWADVLRPRANAL